MHAAGGHAAVGMHAAAGQHPHGLIARGRQSAEHHRRLRRLRASLCLEPLVDAVVSLLCQLELGLALGQLLQEAELALEGDGHLARLLGRMFGRLGVGSLAFRRRQLQLQQLLLGLRSSGLSRSRGLSCSRGRRRRRRRRRHRRCLALRRQQGLDQVPQLSDAAWLVVRRGGGGAAAGAGQDLPGLGQDCARLVLGPSSCGGSWVLGPDLGPPDLGPDEDRLLEGLQ